MHHLWEWQSLIVPRISRKLAVAGVTLASRGGQAWQAWVQHRDFSLEPPSLTPPSSGISKRWFRRSPNPARSANHGQSWPISISKSHQNPMVFSPPGGGPALPGWTMRCRSAWCGIFLLTQQCLVHKMAMKKWYLERCGSQNGHPSVGVFFQTFWVAPRFFRTWDVPKQRWQVGM